MKITRFCPAKVNLFLEVTGKRPDGYHELATLFGKINFGDTLTVEAVPAPQTNISLTLTGPVAPLLQADASNLACRAARTFLEHFHLTADVQITLENTPPRGPAWAAALPTRRAYCWPCAKFLEKIKTNCSPPAPNWGRTYRFLCTKTPF